MLRDKLAAQGVHLHIIAPLPGESIDKAVFGTMAKCDAFLAMATTDYGANTGNTASTYHEVRTWREEYQPKDKPLIPLRMVSSGVRVCFVHLSRDMGASPLHRFLGTTSLSTRRRASSLVRICWRSRGSRASRCPAGSWMKFFEGWGSSANPGRRDRSGNWGRC